MTDEQFVDIQKQVRLTPDQLEFAKENPKGLTKEGCEEEIKNWKMSNNKYSQAMYGYMLKNCKNFTPSGKTVDGRVIFAREGGKVSWSSSLPD